MYQRILALESSCDETAFSIIDFAYGKKPIVHSNLIFSQIEFHAQYGGVVPELAARKHAENIIPLINRGMDEVQAKLSLNREELIQSITAIAVTQGPGLVTALGVGLETAKTLAWAWKKPLIPVNHVFAHLLSPALDIDNYDTLFPLLAVIVSGGNTALYKMSDPSQAELLGDTLDDAAGEAFDKVAKILRLPYPGGPNVSRIAEQGDKDAILFPRPMLKSGLDFSFAGLKTSVLYTVRDMAGIVREGMIGKGVDTSKLSEKDVANICASFEWSVVDVLTQKSIRAAKNFSLPNIFLGGGVSANTLLRNHMAKIAQKNGMQFFVADRAYTGDNAAMIAFAAGNILHFGLTEQNYLNFKPLPNWQCGS